MAVLLLILALCRCINTLPISENEYLEMREQLLGKQYQMRIGGTMNLSDAELCVNAILMNFKGKELEVARRNVTNFPPAVHFFRAKELIDDSEVFRIIRSMPKGMLLLARVMGQYCFGGWRLSSSCVVCNAAGVRAAGRVHSRRPGAWESGGGPVELRLVRATPC